MAELIVITGGSYSGKTALIQELAARGHEVLPEAAYEVIAELVEAQGVDAQREWRLANQVEFQRLITVRQQAREVAARRSSAPYVFCDRGALDGIAYCRIAGVEWPDDLRRLVDGSTYAHVFILETLSAFDPRHDSGRVHTHEDSLRVASLLTEVYEPCANELTFAPERTLHERTGAVLRTLGLP